MGARYVWRMDDITPGMNWARFWAFIELFRTHGVKPLLGIVPENRDPNLCPEPEHPDFWHRLRDLGSSGAVEFAQHGYQHRYVSTAPGLLTAAMRLKSHSEFAGLPFAEQERKIRLGRETLQREGIFTDAWIAPAHSFDRMTLQALARSGFRLVSDGIGLYPVERDGLIFVPQQFWRPRRMPFGVVTICLHTNHADEDDYRSVDAFLSSGARSAAFTEAATPTDGVLETLANVAFERALPLLQRARAIAPRRP